VDIGKELRVIVVEEEEVLVEPVQVEDDRQPVESKKD